MTLKFLLDTHILVRWLYEPRTLSREQARILREAQRRGNPVAISAITLIEVATLVSDGRHRLNARAEDIFEQLEMCQIFQILPITIPIAEDTSALGVLRDPADRTIVATARVHGLRLLTSDRRIVDSKLVPVIE